MMPNRDTKSRRQQDVFKWRGSQGKRQEATDSSCSDTKWSGRDTIMAFTVYCLLWRYNDVIANVEEPAWTHFEVRIQELIVALVAMYFSYLLLKVKYGDFNQMFQRESSPSLLYNVCWFPAEENVTIDDLMNERDVAAQTFRKDFAKETSDAKKRHCNEMKRLNKQGRELRRTLAIQWKDARKKLEEKKTLLSELQQKLIPLEKETTDYLLEKEIIEKKLEEESRRYTDLMSRINKVNHQMEIFSACPESSKVTHNEEKRGNMSGEVILGTKTVAGIDLVLDLKPDVENCVTVMSLGDQTTDTSSSEDEDKKRVYRSNTDNASGNKVLGHNLTSVCSDSSGIIDTCTVMAATGVSDDAPLQTDTVIDDDLNAVRSERDLPRAQQKTESAEKVGVLSGNEDSTSVSSSAIEAEGSPGSTNQTSTSEPTENEVKNSEIIVSERDLPTSENNAAEVNSSDEQTVSTKAIKSENLLSHYEKNEGELSVKEASVGAAQNPDADIVDVGKTHMENMQNKQTEKATKDTKQAKSEKMSINNQFANSIPEQLNRNVNMNRNANMDISMNARRHVNMDRNLSMNTNIILNRNQMFNQSLNNFNPAPHFLSSSVGPEMLGNLNSNQQQEMFSRGILENQQERLQGVPVCNRLEGWIQRNQQQFMFQWAQCTQQPQERFQRGPGWFNRYSGSVGRR